MQVSPVQPAAQSQAKALTATAGVPSARAAHAPPFLQGTETHLDRARPARRMLEHPRDRNRGEGLVPRDGAVRDCAVGSAAGAGAWLGRGALVEVDGALRAGEQALLRARIAGRGRVEGPAGVAGAGVAEVGVDARAVDAGALLVAANVAVVHGVARLAVAAEASGAGAAGEGRVAGLHRAGWHVGAGRMQLQDDFGEAGGARAAVGVRAALRGGAEARVMRGRGTLHTPGCRLPTGGLRPVALRPGRTSAPRPSPV